MQSMEKEHKVKPLNVLGSKYKYTCEICQQQWVGVPTSKCPGMKAFSPRTPENRPSHFKTIRELESKGLHPRDREHPSAAFLPYNNASWEYLYDETKAIPIRLGNTILKLVKMVGGFGVVLFNFFVTGLASILFGFNAPPASLATVPIVAFVLHYPTIALIIFCGLMLITFIGSLLFVRLTSNINVNLLRRHIHPWSIVTATSTISFVLCFAMLVTVLVRPSWCPQSLCLPASAANLPGIHDSNLDLYFLAFQGDSIVIPGDPIHSLVNSIANERSSDTIHAVLLKNHLPSSIYRVVLVARSLYQGQYSIVIDQIALTVVDQPAMPQSLNIWPHKSFAQYDASRYGILYSGQGIGEVLTARYLETPDGFTQLATNEADQLDIQIASHISVALKFRMQVTYHIATETKKYTLELPNIFEVIFSDSSNWHPYQLQSGHFSTMT